MGWKSTIDMTREDAVRHIEKYLSKASDEEIALALESLIGERIGANFTIRFDAEKADLNVHYNENYNSGYFVDLNRCKKCGKLFVHPDTRDGSILCWCPPED